MPNANRRRDDGRLSVLQEDLQLVKESQESMAIVLSVHASDLAANKVAIDANTVITGEIKRNTDEIVSIFGTMKNGMQTLHWVSLGLKWFGKHVLLPAALVYGFIYAITHHGQIPPWLKELAAFLE